MIKMYWSRILGKFTDKLTGDDMSEWTTWHGTAREWYETLIEVIWDLVNSLSTQGVDPDVISDLEISADFPVQVMTYCSVLWGTKMGIGPILDVKIDDSLKHRVELRNRDTHEVLGTVHVLDIPCPDA